jgi:ABC-type Fe3+/spermidine/putrescine transport system ATPase subunit
MVTAGGQLTRSETEHETRMLRDGATMQSGPVAEIFQKPANSFVAGVVGSENILDARIAGITGRMVELAVGDRTLRAAASAHYDGATKPVRLSIRAEDASIAPSVGNPAPSPDGNRFEGRIAGLRPLGPPVMVKIDGGFPLKAYALAPQARALNLGIGKPIAVTIAVDAIHVMPD